MRLERDNLLFFLNYIIHKEHINVVVLEKEFQTKVFKYTIREIF